MEARARSRVAWGFTARCGRRHVRPEELRRGGGVHDWGFTRGGRWHGRGGGQVRIGGTGEEEVGCGLAAREGKRSGANRWHEVG